MMAKKNKDKKKLELIEEANEDEADKEEDDKKGREEE